MKESGASDADLLEAGYFFLQAVGQSYLLINETEFSKDYISRFENLKLNKDRLIFQNIFC
jgi:hypothetical protein